MSAQCPKERERERDSCVMFDLVMTTMAMRLSFEYEMKEEKVRSMFTQHGNSIQLMSQNCERDEDRT